MICFYCDKPIAANEESVSGKKAVAHRACVRARVVEGLPDAMEHEFAGIKRRGHTGSRPRSHCRRGHALTSDNLYIFPGGGRRCKKCRAHDEEQRKLRRAASRSFAIRG
jgi:hypothetical protein